MALLAYTAMSFMMSVFILRLHHKTGPVGENYAKLTHFLRKVTCNKPSNTVDIDVNSRPETRGTEDAQDFHMEPMRCVEPSVLSICCFFNVKLG